MIQRIQSIFLLLASGAFFSLFKLPFSTSSTVLESIYSDQRFDLFDNQILMVLIILGGVCSLLAIFLFRNRKLQINISFISLILALATLGFGAWIYSSSMPTEETSVQLSLGFVLPIISLLFSILAIVFIKKDTKLVESMDRLR